MDTRTNAKELQVGDYLSRVSYMQVLKRDMDTLLVTNEEGYVWTIQEQVLANEAYSATQFNETKQVSRTELIEVLEDAGDTIFSVTFNKKVSQKDVVSALYNLDVLPEKQTDIRKLVKSFLEGEERTLVGYLVQTEPKMGRSTVVDLEAKGGYNLRLVDHRTIKSITIRNVRYELKK